MSDREAAIDALNRARDELADVVSRHGSSKSEISQYVIRLGEQRVMAAELSLAKAEGRIEEFFSPFPSSHAP